MEQGMSESANLKRNIEGFQQNTRKMGDRINNASDIWKDSNYSSLQKQMGELAKASKSVIENGERACASIDKFFNIASERI